MATCTFTGTKNNIPDYTLGSQKKVTVRIDVVENGNPHHDIIKNPTWKIGPGGKESGAIKNYEITSEKGVVAPLTQNDFEQPAMLFKLWKSSSEHELIQCTGNTTHGEVTASGTMSVEKNVSATFKNPQFLAPVVMQGHDMQFPEFSRVLVSSFDVKLQTGTNGNLGVIHLVQSRIIQINRSSGGRTTIVDTGNEFVLYTKDPSYQNPVHNEVKVVNGVIQRTADDDGVYGFDLEILQTIQHEYTYEFEEKYESYLVFKGNAPGDVWHPVSFENNSSTVPVFMKCEYKCRVSFGTKKEGYWDFSEYASIPPSFPPMDKLPQWNRNIHECVKIIIPAVKIANAPLVVIELATADNVHEFIHICSLLGKPPELHLSPVEQAKSVNAFLGSVYGGYSDFMLTDVFVNATYTTRDPKNGETSWVSLWAREANGGQRPIMCTSTPVPIRGCKGKLVGGHVVRGLVSHKVKDGGSLFIFPICSRHNGIDHLAMNPFNYQRAVILKKFMK